MKAITRSTQYLLHGKNQHIGLWEKLTGFVCLPVRLLTVRSAVIGQMTRATSLEFPDACFIIAATLAGAVLEDESLDALL